MNYIKTTSSPATLDPNHQNESKSIIGSKLRAHQEITNKSNTHRVQLGNRQIYITTQNRLSLNQTSNHQSPWISPPWSCKRVRAWQRKIRELNYVPQTHTILTCMSRSHDFKSRNSKPIRTLLLLLVKSYMTIMFEKLKRTFGLESRKE